MALAQLPTRQRLAFRGRARVLGHESPSTTQGRATVSPDRPLDRGEPLSYPDGGPDDLAAVLFAALVVVAIAIMVVDVQLLLGAR